MNIPKPEEITTKEQLLVLLAGLHEKAEELCQLANHYGLVLTIETKPLEPLAMGHYELVSDIRAGHAIYRGQA